MTHKNEVKTLVLTLLVTLSCLGAGFQLFRSFEAASTSGETAVELPEAQTDLPVTASHAVEDSHSPEDDAPEDSVKPKELAIAPNFAQVPEVPAGFFNYGGSTTWAPIRGSVDFEIQKARPEFRLNYVQPREIIPSSQTGLEMLVQGELAFSLASRLPSNELLETLKAKGTQVRLVPVAKSFDVPAVNWSLPLTVLTIDQFYAIQAGKIINWRDVGGPDLPIQQFDRSVNDDFLDTRPNLETENIELLATPSEAIRRVAGTPGGIYVHTASVLVPQCEVKVLALESPLGQRILPYQEPLVPASDCPARRNQVNLEALSSGNYPKQLQDTLYVVINQNGAIEQQAGEAYASFLLSDEGQALLERNGYLRIRQ
ncbi:MAG: substrate-binding domain-containing protein [Cyanobacteria bacterium J06639_14]